MDKRLMALESGPKVNIKIIAGKQCLASVFSPEPYSTVAVSYYIAVRYRFGARYPPLSYNIKPMWVPLIPARDLLAENASRSDEMIVFDDDK